MPPAWLKSPQTFFSRSSSLNSVPTLSTPSTTHPLPTSSSDEDDEGLRILTPFEREYGKPDLPGAWLDGKVLSTKLREVSVAQAAGDEEEAKALDDEAARGEEDEKDIRVTRLMVHPIKSCRGILLQRSLLTPQGLEFDRQWAIRGIKSKKLLTAREYPEASLPLARASFDQKKARGMVLINCEIDEPAKRLYVTFPSRSPSYTLDNSVHPTGPDGSGSGENQAQNTSGDQDDLKVDLPGFSVDLRVDVEMTSHWEKIPSSILHGGSIPPSLLVPASQSPHPNLSPSPNTSLSTPIPSPSEQLSTYLHTPVQLIRTSLLKEDQRKCEVPPGQEEAEEWVEGVARMRVAGQEVDGDVAEEDEQEDVITGFADGYPFLIANEESYRSVSSSILQSTRPDPPSHLSSTFGTSGGSSKTSWSTRSFDHRRFRANVVVGSSRDLPVEMQDDLLDDAGVRGGLDRDETNQKGQNKAGENKLNAWEEDTWRELEFSAPDSISSTEGRKGGLICTSRCGRCQLPNVCPDTAEQDKVVPFKIIAKYRRVDPAQKFIPIFGVNAISTELKGSFEIAVGDRVRVVSKNRWGSLPIASLKDKA